ncbi:phenylalanine--tRNA ligase beta subunit-related protein [Streptomyces sp. 15-116A]|uniref:B3/B4 domain-containing protein n=1 Tax=Streptomyces sp. 15-116A TaxID=2259035 RepID=UPI0021B20ECF|nr:phenylalanine--tRNA ligase beta subunit-related protein [Streptomyces sp. 15-116A]MCT7353232.1 phenylalanine--tRNA ligase beta subunit-related protein [Streptomyces sp. 15-116A]
MDQSPSPAAPLTVTVAERLLERVPGYVLGLIAVERMDVEDTVPAVDSLLTEAEDALHAAALGKAEVSALPSIAAWREAYRAVDVNPNRYPCAAESLLRRVAKGDRLPRINTAVDLCNGVSLAARLPVASCDIGDLDGELTVRPADGHEVYLPLGAPDAPEHPGTGEVIYADDRGRAHSRRWNWRQGDVIRTERGPRRLVFTVEAVHDGGADAVAAALGRIGEVLDTLGVGHDKPVVLDRTTRSAALFTAGVPQTAR